MLHDAGLKDVANIDAFSKLRDQCTLAHAFSATYQDHKRDLFLIEACDELISLHIVVRVRVEHEFLEQYALKFGLGHFGLVLLYKVLFYF